jgi:hypothetical protein
VIVSVFQHDGSGKRSRRTRDEARSDAEDLRDRLKTVCGLAPNPCELDGQIRDPDQVEQYRLLKCPGYQACLDVARKGDWCSFTCRVCPVFRLYARSNEWTRKIKMEDK